MLYESSTGKWLAPDMSDGAFKYIRDMAKADYPITPKQIQDMIEYYETELRSLRTEIAWSKAHPESADGIDGDIIRLGKKSNQDLWSALNGLVRMIDTHREIYAYEKQQYVIDENEEWIAARQALDENK